MATFIIIMLGLLLVQGLWAVFGQTVASWVFDKTDLSTVAQWGDSFGVVNSTLTAIGTAGIVYTLILQQRDLRQQHEDIAVQKADQHRIAFESSFFQLLQLLRELRDGVGINLGGYRGRRYDVKGVDAFYAAIQEFEDAALNPVDAQMRSVLPQNWAEIASLYEKAIHRSGERTLSPYFRIVYTILRRIDDDALLTKDEKARYGNILRSQMTSSEIMLMALNATIPESKNFSDYLTKFHMLKYIPSDGLVSNLLREHYSGDAFASRD